MFENVEYNLLDGREMILICCVKYIRGFYLLQIYFKELITNRDDILQSDL